MAEMHSLSRLNSTRETIAGFNSYRHLGSSTPEKLIKLVVLVKLFHPRGRRKQREDRSKKKEMERNRLTTMPADRNLLAAR
jgi:hypothetical protein